ncbi:MAG: DUF1345 domain-containing protein [Pseudomonadota bacterium]
MKGLSAAFTRHFRFYIALVCGLAAWALCRSLDIEAAPLAGGDVFYLVFLAFCISLARQKSSDLKKRAKSEDEGIVVVLLIVLATMAFFCAAVFMALSGKHDVLSLALAMVGAPLGWLVLHTVMAFHYADLHYFEDPDGHEGPDLQFPGRGDPGPWDFLYFSFVIGMTAQTSDVQIKQCGMRRTVLLHSIVSFFFNTVFIAMAVNAAVSLAG